MSCVYIVSYVETYDVYEVSYHKTKKGAYKWIMSTMYEEWNKYRWLHPDYTPYYVVDEKELKE